MKSIKFLLLLQTLSWFSFANAKVTPVDSIQTTYKNGVFYTHCRVWVNASEEVTLGILNDFMSQFSNDIDKLFIWALKDLKLQGEGDDFIVYHLKSSQLDEDTGIIYGKMDAIVPGITAFKDIAINGRMYEKEGPKNKQIVQYDVISSTGFVKEANATFCMTHINAQSAWCTLDVRVKFGWFFNMFITQKRYKENLEWRFSQMARNLNKEATYREKNRQKDINKKK